MFPVDVHTVSRVEGFAGTKLQGFVSFGRFPFDFIPSGVNALLNRPKLNRPYAAVVRDYLLAPFRRDGHNASCVVTPVGSVAIVHSTKLALLEEVAETAIGF